MTALVVERIAQARNREHLARRAAAEDVRRRQEAVSDQDGDLGHVAQVRYVWIAMAQHGDA